MGSITLHLKCLGQRVSGSEFFLEESWVFDPWHGNQGLGAGWSDAMAADALERGSSDLRFLLLRQGIEDEVLCKR